MALIDFLYLCPFCGQDPMEGDAESGRCPSCRRSFTPGEGGTRIRVEDEGGVVLEYTARSLSLRLEGYRAGSARPGMGEDAAILQADAWARFAASEEPVRHGGRLLGFFERIGEPLQGVLSLSSDELRFRAMHPAGPRSWSLTDIRSLQAVSASIQITDGSGELAHFHFPSDSSRRWEDALRAAIAASWAIEGREVIEFQPRIVTR